MDEIKLNHIYSFADLIERHIYGHSGFWNYSEPTFVDRSLKFRKETLLHHFIETTIWNYYNREFRKHLDVYVDNEDFIEFLNKLFTHYIIPTKEFSISENETALEEKFLAWWNEGEFRLLFNKIADDVFYILFGNRRLLLQFNLLVAETVVDNTYPLGSLTANDKIKRKNIPQWVKKAVFLRDKGRCTKCTKDLTGLIAIDAKQHYDHMVPLNQHGVNDPSNIQLLCESCNLKKSGTIIETSNLYSRWWK